MELGSIGLVVLDLAKMSNSTPPSLENMCFMSYNDSLKLYHMPGQKVQCVLLLYVGNNIFTNCYGQ